MAKKAAVPKSPKSGKRNDKWIVIGPGGGGGQFYPTVSPHDENVVFVRCDMTGSYLSKDGGESWRMFNLRSTGSWYVFDPVKAEGVLRVRPRPVALDGRGQDLETRVPER